METTVAAANTSLTERQLDASLFTDFVNWIDRGEKTTRSYITNLRQFVAWLKYNEIDRPTRNDIILYRQWLAAEHDAIEIDPSSSKGWKYRTDAAGNVLRISCKPNTTAQYLRNVCQFFTWTAENGLYPNIAANIHAPKVSHGTHHKEALTPAEVLTIENSITDSAKARTAAAANKGKDTAGQIQRSTEQGKRLYAMYMLAVNAGLRTIELSRANIKDLTTRNGQAYLYIFGKGHTEPDQKKPISKEVKAAIDDYLQSRTDAPTGSSPLFVATGNRSKGQRIAATTISTMLKQAMQEAGFDSEKITAHSLRHTTGTSVMQLTGSNIYKTQNYMRHSNPATTEIYLHNDTDQQDAEIADRLYNLYHGSATTDARARLEQLLNKLSNDELEQLADIAEQMAQ